MTEPLHPHKPIVLDRLPQALVEARKAFHARVIDELPDGEVFEMELVVDAGVATLQLKDGKRTPPGNPGVQGYGPGGGVANNFDHKPTYRPYNARGLNRNFGLYHQTYLDSAAYQRGLGKIVEGLTTGHWYVEPVSCADEYTQRLADVQAEQVQKVLFGIEGGWSKHVLEALYAYIAGFAPFIRVTDGFGQLRGLSFRYPSQVNRWYTNPQESELLGVEFGAASGGTDTYRIAAHELLLYQVNAVGNNWEGISPLRGVLKYAKMYELFLQIEACAAEKYGCPVTFVERPTGQYDKSSDDAVVAMLDAFVATDNAVLLLPGGYKVTVASPTGQVPDFEPIKRYLNEQIALALTAEGALVGLNGQGAYNLAEMKDTQALRTLAYYARWIADAINGTGLAYNGVIAGIVAHLPHERLREHFHGELPKLRWSLSAEQDETSVEQVISAKVAGLITWTPEDETWLRARLKLTTRSEEETEQDALEQPGVAHTDPAALPAAADAGASVADTALNGAQVASMIEIIASVESRKISARSGVELLKRAFLMDEQAASALLNVAPGAGTAPGAEQLPAPAEEVT